MSDNLSPNQRKDLDRKLEILNLHAGSVKQELDATILIFRAASQMQDNARCETLRANCTSLLEAHLDLVQQTTDTILIAYGIKK